jgi:hypothetical protein
VAAATNVTEIAGTTRIQSARPSRRRISATPPAIASSING